MREEDGKAEIDHLSEEEQAEREAKLAKLEKEKKELLTSLAGGDFSTLKTKVAYILNLYPQARNSDITLSIKYWETFQPEVYNESGILPKDLFKLERLHYIVRARAKIQNEYGLFTSDSPVKKFRKKREEEMQDEVLKDASPRKVVTVFADETGKNQNYVIVASVWVLTGRAVYTISKNISDWQSSSLWANREVHFTKFGRRDSDTLGEYLKIIQGNREFLSFKAIAVERSRTRRKIEDVVEKLHEHMLINGVEHEVEHHRVGPPQTINVTLDEEQSLDAITLAEVKRRVNSHFEDRFCGEMTLGALETISSRKSPLVQLADLIAGAINRKLNHTGEQNHKDEMADKVIHALDLQLGEEEVDGIDVTTLFKI